MVGEVMVEMELPLLLLECLLLTLVVAAEAQTQIPEHLDLVELAVAEMVVMLQTVFLELQIQEVLEEEQELLRA